MATTMRNSQSREVVKGLIRPDLRYRSEDESHRRIAMAKVACTHGTTVDSILRLAADGRFSGGTSTQFSATPNSSFRNWHKTPLSQDGIQAIQDKPVDTLRESIEYSQGGEETRHGLEASVAQDFVEARHGVVVTLTIDAIKPGSSVYEDAYEEVVELMIPSAPEIETIESIYPVNNLAAIALDHALTSLK